MACCRIGNKPLSETLLTRFTDAYKRADEWGDELICHNEGKTLRTQRMFMSSGVALPHAVTPVLSC